MRSLVLSRWAPDRVDGGAALRNRQNIVALANLGPVEVMSIGGPEERVHSVQGVARWEHFPPRPPAPGLSGVWFLDRRRHPLLDHQIHPEAMARIAALPRDSYDVAVVEEIALAGYIASLRAAGIPTVFDAHNVEARLRADIDRAGEGGGWRKQLRRYLHDWRLRAIEARAMQEADLVWACSKVDAALISRLYRPRRPVTEVPNGVDLAAYRTARDAQAAGPEKRPLLLYIGTYGYRPNEVAALRLMTRVLPELQARGLELTLAVVGRNPTPAMRQIAARNSAVTVTGAVDSVLPWLSRPAIMVLPITLGGGTRLKIIEAFAAACPVVSTSKGAEGIEVRPGENILLGESDAELAEAVARLVASPALARRIGAAGHETALRLYSRQAATDRIRASLLALRDPVAGQSTLGAVG